MFHSEVNTQATAPFLSASGPPPLLPYVRQGVGPPQAAHWLATPATAGTMTVRQAHHDEMLFFGSYDHIIISNHWRYMTID